MGQPIESLLIRAPIGHVADDRAEIGMAAIVPHRQRQLDREDAAAPVLGIQLDAGADQARRATGGHAKQPVAVTAAHRRRHDQVEAGASRLRRAITEQSLGGGVPESDEPLVVGADDAVGRRRGDVLEPRLALFARDLEPAQLQLFQHQRGQHPHHCLVGVREPRARLPVDDAQRADVVTRRRPQRNAGVEADMGIARHQGVVGEPRVESRVGNDQNVRTPERMGTERDVTPGLADVQALRAEKELLVLADQRHGGDRHLEQRASERNDRVELQVDAAVEQVILL